MKVRLNLATTPLESNRRFTAGASLLGGVAIIALFVLSFQVFSIWRSDTTLRAQRDALQTQILKLQQQRDELAAFFENPATVARRQRAAYLNSLIQQRAFPWIRIFMDLEKILPEGVRVVSIAPKLVGDSVQLKVEIGAASDENKVKFLKALENSAAFSHIQLLSETRPTLRSGQTDQVLLELQAQYSVI